MEDKGIIRVLLVDDEEQQFLIIKDIFDTIDSKFHFAVDWATDSYECIEQLNEIEYDVCLMDYFLGHENGLSLLKTMRRDKIEVPVILITGENRNSMDNEALNAGVEDYLVKGDFDGRKLERAIRFAVDRKEKSEEEKFKSTHFTELGLPNRLAFMDQLKNTINRSSRKPNDFYAVLKVDIDKFSRVNELYGFNSGNKILKDVVERFKKCIRAEDHLAHIEGHQFAIVSEDLEDYKLALLISNRLQNEFKAPFNVEGEELYLQLNIGVVPGNSFDQDPDQLLRDASRACDQSKKNLCGHVIYDHGLGNKATQIIKMESELRRALNKEEFVIHYQPIVSVTDEKIRGYEALVRWKHPKKGILSPDDFIPLAEDTGLIIPLGEWVLNESLKQTKKWHQSGFRDLKLAVNFSSRQFHEIGMAKTIQKALEYHKVRPEFLELEITETAAMSDLEASLNQLRHLKEMGICISIDDFGTGYSSLASLRKFPIHTLKIDRSFTSEIGPNSERHGIIKAIISMAKYLNLNIIAEGVETDIQLEFLREEGCQEFQGFLFSKPLESNDLSERIQREIA